MATETKWSAFPTRASWVQGVRWAQRLSYYRVYRTTTTEHNYGSIPPGPMGRGIEPSQQARFGIASKILQSLVRKAFFLDFCDLEGPLLSDGVWQTRGVAKSVTWL